MTKIYGEIVQLESLGWEDQWKNTGNVPKKSPNFEDGQSERGLQKGWRKNIKINGGKSKKIERIFFPASKTWSLEPNAAKK